MQKIKANFHLHTIWSDGLFTPKMVARLAQKRGFGIVVVTDHNEWRGSAKFCKLAKRYSLLSLYGAELFFMDDGKLSELLVYFRTANEIKLFLKEFRADHFNPMCDNVGEVIALVYRHGGVCIAPHPFAHKGLLGHGDAADFIGMEVANSFVSPTDNKKAREYYDSHLQKYLGFGGSDMHCWPSALDTAFTTLESNQEITIDELWANLRGDKQTISFKPVGGSLSLFKRFIQEVWAILAATKYLIFQDVAYLRLHNFHNFKKHHRS